MKNDEPSYVVNIPEIKLEMCHPTLKTYLCVMILVRSERTYISTHTTHGKDSKKDDQVTEDPVSHHLHEFPKWIR